MLGLNEASDPAKEFGALSFLIVICLGRRPGAKLRHLPLGADEGAYRPGPPLGVAGRAAGERLVRPVQQTAQGCAAIHSRLTSS